MSLLNSLLFNGAPTTPAVKTDFARSMLHPPASGEMYIRRRRNKYSVEICRGSVSYRRNSIATLEQAIEIRDALKIELGIF